MKFQRRQQIASVGLLAVSLSGIRVPQSAAASVPATSLVSPTQSDTPPTVAAVGDSFTSGLGVDWGQKDLYDQQCGRSDDAYPAVVAKALNLAVNNLACAGAETDALTKSFNGQAPQLSELNGPTYVLTTIGGNNIDFAESMQAAGIMGNTQLVMKKLATLEKKLVTSYKAIQAAAPNADVYAVAYPYIFPNSDKDLASCIGPAGYFIHLNDLHTMTQALNHTAKQAAQKAGINFIDDENVFAGHEMCTTDPWVYKPGSFFQDHPNSQGQQAIGNYIAASILNRPSQSPIVSHPIYDTGDITLPGMTKAANAELTQMVDVILQGIVDGRIKVNLGKNVDLKDVASIELHEDGRLVMDSSADNAWQVRIDRDFVVNGNHTYRLELDKPNGQVLYKESMSLPF